MTAIRAFFPKIRTPFSNFQKKDRGDVNPIPASSYTPVTIRNLSLSRIIVELAFLSSPGSYHHPSGWGKLIIPTNEIYLKIYFASAESGNYVGGEIFLKIIFLPFFFWGEGGGGHRGINLRCFERFLGLLELSKRNNNNNKIVCEIVCEVIRLFVN